MDRDKYRRLFLDEARENLGAYANELVTYERLEDKDDADSAKKKAEAMDAVFRAAHSLKGMAASMGYDAFARLAHRIEDLADVARQGKRLGPTGFDLLLAGGDRLEAMLEQIQAGQEDALSAGDLPERVEALLREAKGERPDGGAHAAYPGPFPPPSRAPEPKPAPAADALVLTVRIADDTPLPQVRAFMVHRALSAMPGWRSTEPPAELLRQTPPPENTVRFTFEADKVDAEALIARAQAEQGVAEAVLGRAAHEPKPAPEPEGARLEEDRTVRVRTAILDEFIDSVAELLLARSRLRTLATRFDAPELGDLVDEVERLTRDLHDRVVAARMTPISFVTDRLPRVVRDLSRQTGKAVDFQLEVGGIEIDRAILDELFTPLLHMVRNAVDHGHEGETARAERGKPPAMRLSLRASRDRDRVLIELDDDGGGIDPVKVKQRALERGLIDLAQVEQLPEHRLVELVCLPGFSTKAEVTETSGRGVGMDVVKDTLERLGGGLRIQSTPGQGSRFTLHLPLTVAILRVLVVEAGGASPSDVFAIPVARVEKALDLDPSMVTEAQGRAHLSLGEGLVPLFDLSKELGFDAGGFGSGTAIVVGHGDDHVAFRVAAVLGQEEVVAKPLGRPLSSLGYLSGATLLADGRAAFILEPHRLFDAV